MLLDGTKGLFGDEDLASACLTLQPRCDVHHVADDGVTQSLWRADGANNPLARVYTDPEAGALSAP